jgi:hypothetical protein
MIFETRVDYSNLLFFSFLQAGKTYRFLDHFDFLRYLGIHHTTDPSFYYISLLGK